MAKGTGSKSKPSKAPAPKSKPAKKSAAAPQQPELEFAAKPAGKAASKVVAEPEAPATPVKAAPDTIQVVELVNGVEGVWKKLSNGKRVDLTTKEWRQELSRLFTRAPAP